MSSENSVLMLVYKWWIQEDWTHSIILQINLFV